jgi:hypothetical protein
MSLFLSGEGSDGISRKDFEHLSRLTLGDLYSRIGWTVSASFNVEPIAGLPATRHPTNRRFLRSKRGKYAFKGAPALHLPKKAWAITVGKRFVAKYTRALRHKICVDWSYCEHRHHYNTAAQLAAIVTPLVNDVLTVPGTVGALVSMVLVKIGLDKFCNCNHTKRKVRKRKRKKTP